MRDNQPPPLRRIAILRALVLGDLLCAVPAWRALRQLAPRARIVLVGLESMRDFVARYPHLIDDFVAFPGHPDFPEQPMRPEAWPPFLAAMRAEHFDLAVQMHGSGENANSIVRGFGARRLAGFTRGEIRNHHRDDVRVTWHDDASEVTRNLDLVAAIAQFYSPRRSPWRAREHALELPIRDDEEAAWQELASHHDLDRTPFVCLHPGARYPSRRWPVDRFAGVAEELARCGLRIVITGAAAEVPLCGQLASLLRERGVDPLDLSGRTGLGTLAALVRDAALVVANDTGISHVAAAMGTPSVIVASGSNVARWAPIDTERHRVVWKDVPCRPCSYVTCPIGHPCALGVSTAEVSRLAQQRLASATACALAS